jgi:hypothetical protein
MIKIKRCQRKSKEKLKNIHKEAILVWILITCSPATAPEQGASSNPTRNILSIDWGRSKTKREQNHREGT